MMQFGAFFNKENTDVVVDKTHTISHYLKQPSTKKQFKRILRNLQTIQKETGEGSTLFEIARTLLFTTGVFSKEHSLYVDDINKETVTSKKQYWGYKDETPSIDFKPNKTSSNKKDADVIAFGLYQLAIGKYCTASGKSMSALQPSDVPSIVSIYNGLKSAGIKHTVSAVLYTDKNGKTTTNPLDCADPTNPKTMVWKFPAYYPSRAPPMTQTCCHKK